MAWLFLLVAGLCEIAWAIGLKYTEGFSRLLPTIGTVAAMAASIGCLGIALKSLPVGTAYAVWTGIGTIGTTVAGIYLFNEPATLLRLACIGLILSGIIGLKITSNSMRRGVDLAEGRRSKIALQRAAPPDVERWAKECPAKRGVMQGLAWNRFESPFLHR